MLSAGRCSRSRTAHARAAAVRQVRSEIEQFALRKAQVDVVTKLRADANIERLDERADWLGRGQAPAFEIEIGWFGFVAPAATPSEVVATLNPAIVATPRDRAIREGIRAMGAEPCLESHGIRQTYPRRI